MTMTTPAVRPANACFSSGPCAKRPGWTPQNLKDAALGRSHRAKIGKVKLKLQQIADLGNVNPVYVTGDGTGDGQGR